MDNIIIIHKFTVFNNKTGKILDVFELEGEVTLLNSNEYWKYEAAKPAGEIIGIFLDLLWAKGYHQNQVHWFTYENNLDKLVKGGVSTHSIYKTVEKYLVKVYYNIENLDTYFNLSPGYFEEKEGVVIHVPYEITPIKLSLNGSNGVKKQLEFALKQGLQLLELLT